MQSSSVAIRRWCVNEDNVVSDTVPVFFSHNLAQPDLAETSFTYKNEWKKGNL